MSAGGGAAVAGTVAAADGADAGDVAGVGGGADEGASGPLERLPQKKWMKLKTMTTHGSSKRRHSSAAAVVAVVAVDGRVGS
jgi:hypothetical protein